MSEREDETPPQREGLPDEQGDQSSANQDEGAEESGQQEETQASTAEETLEASPEKQESLGDEIPLRSETPSRSELLLISCRHQERRVAYLESGRPVELFLERKQEASLVGNLYKGRVERVLPGIQAAFIDIGLNQAAFLYVDDIAVGRFATYPSGLSQSVTQTIHGNYEGRGGHSIQQLLQEGQELIVQVSKDPISTKGARVTNHLSIAGRHLVYMPQVDTIGVSRRISDETERQRLKTILEELVPQGGGFVARTAAEEQSAEALQADLELLRQLWNDILARVDSFAAPATLYEDLDLPRRALRDLSNDALERVLIDDPDEFHRLQDFAERFLAPRAPEIELYSATEPLFEAYGVEEVLNRALSRTVPLPSGGTLVIDQAEALTAIDVNTARYVGDQNFEETIVNTNLEAAVEIAYQLRLRNLGGIIILDFIDMDSEGSRERVHKTLLESLRRDRSKSNVQKISGLGLIEMTRKRVRDSLQRTFCEPCFYCNGTGFLKSVKTLSYELYRELSERGETLSGRRLLVELHPRLIQALEEGGRPLLSELELRFSLEITLSPLPTLHLEDFSVSVLD
ncbi:MAG: Rne/Rng family ribonuclease [Myxococcota bacterium]|nr:Rne/Rng family ribonuclease [Myxococcota bacterium]